MIIVLPLHNNRPPQNVGCPPTCAGIATPQHQLIKVAGKTMLLSRRFERAGATRNPFLSAMAMMGVRDGECGSYQEIVDAVAQHGAQAKTDAHDLIAGSCSTS